MTPCFSTVRFPRVNVLSARHKVLPPDSGHGGQTKDLDGDEGDGYDEGVVLPHHADIVVNRESVYQ